MTAQPTEPRRRIHTQNWLHHTSWRAIATARLYSVGKERTVLISIPFIGDNILSGVLASGSWRILGPYTAPYFYSTQPFPVVVDATSTRPTSNAMCA